MLRVVAMVCPPKMTRRLLTVWLTLLSAAGCSGDVTAAGPPRGPKDFRIAQVSGVANGVSSPEETLTVSCGEPLLVWIAPAQDGKVGDFKLAPPGKCTGESNCGWIHLTLSAPGAEERAVDSAATPLRVDLPPEGFNAAVQFHAELRDSDGAAVLTDGGQALAADLTVNVAPCIP